jgi:hypothetical protein
MDMRANIDDIIACKHSRNATMSGLAPAGESATSACIEVLNKTATGGEDIHAFSNGGNAFTPAMFGVVGTISGNTAGILSIGYSMEVTSDGKGTRASSRATTSGSTSITIKMPFSDGNAYTHSKFGSTISLSTLWLDRWSRCWLNRSLDGRYTDQPGDTGGHRWHR